MKNERKKITKASRRARISSVFKASSTTMRVTPASRPRMVLCVAQVAPSKSASRPIRHCHPGKGRPRSVNVVRHTSTPAVSTPHHQGM